MVQYEPLRDKFRAVRRRTGILCPQNAENGGGAYAVVYMRGGGFPHSDRICQRKAALTGKES